MTNRNELLREIIHKPVTFTKETIQKDTDELNKALLDGYKIHDYVRTETGIVYVLGRWENQQSNKTSIKKATSENNLKEHYEELLEETN